MQIPGPANWLLLLYLFAFLPWAARLSALRSRAVPLPPDSGVAAALFPTPARLYVSTLWSLAFLFCVSWLAAREMGHDLFSVRRFGLRELLACIGFLGACFALQPLSRYVRTQQELRTLPVLKIVPRTRRDWRMFVFVAIGAGLAEESAYRGAGASTLQWMLGSAWLAALLSAVAFALAHWPQGWKSMVIIFVSGLLMQGLVAVTGTLVGAMVVHAVLDLLSAYRLHLLLERFEREDRAAATPG